MLTDTTDRNADVLAMWAYHLHGLPGPEMVFLLPSVQFAPLTPGYYTPTGTHSIPTDNRTISA